MVFPAIARHLGTAHTAYAALAVDLATNPQKRRKIRDKLSRQRLAMPLFDTARFTRSLEAAYIATVERRQAGLPPDHFCVNSPLK